MKKLKFISIFILAFSVLTLSAEKKENPFKIDLEKEIVFGQSAFLAEGSLQLYGELIRNAILAKFKSVNEEGGINGKTLRLISVDDSGAPEKTAENITLMRNYKIDMFIGNTGTRSVFKILPLIQEKQIALFFPWGGDKKLRQPHLSHLINGVGWIEPQIKAIAEYAIETLRLKKIAIFHDDGDFGITNKNMLIQELKNKNVGPVSIASYNRFTMDIQRPAQTLLKSDPKVVMCLATSMPTVKLINKFFEHGHYGTKFIGIDSTMFAGNILQRKGIPFRYASPVPDPEDQTIPIVKEFQINMKKYFPDDTVNILSLAYYIHASIIAEALKKITGDITKEKVITQIEQMKNYDLGGFTVDFNRTTRHAYPHNIKILKSVTLQKTQEEMKKGGK